MSDTITEDNRVMLDPSGMDVMTSEWWETRIIEILKRRRQQSGGGASAGGGGASASCGV